MNHDFECSTQCYHKDMLPLNDRYASVEKRIAKKYGVDPENLSKSFYRDKQLVRARRELWFIARHGFNESYPSIGRRYGFDHTSIRSGVMKYRP